MKNQAKSIEFLTKKIWIEETAQRGKLTVRTQLRSGHWIVDGRAGKMVTERREVFGEGDGGKVSKAKGLSLTDFVHIRDNWDEFYAVMSGQKYMAPPKAASDEFPA